MPFLLIQGHGFSATAAGAAFLPFTVIMGALSGTSGRMADRVGPRRHLVIGPIVVAVGFLLLLWSSGQQRYWVFLVGLGVLGLGMTVTVAPLTTLVMNSVAGSQAGIASGINNAVASVASLVVLSASGTVALRVYNRALEQHSSAQAATIDMFRSVMLIAIVLCLASAAVAAVTIKDSPARAPR